MSPAIPTAITTAPTAHPAGGAQFGVDEFLPALNAGVAAVRQAQQECLQAWRTGAKRPSWSDHHSAPVVA
jgi:hypothetical protein